MIDVQRLQGQRIERAYPDAYDDHASFDLALVIGGQPLVLRHCAVRLTVWQARALSWEECQALITGRLVAEVEVSKRHWTAMLTLDDGTLLVGQLTPG